MRAWACVCECGNLCGRMPALGPRYSRISDIVARGRRRPWSWGFRIGIAISGMMGLTRLIMFCCKILLQLPRTFLDLHSMPYRAGEYIYWARRLWLLIQFWQLHWHMLCTRALNFGEEPRNVLMVQILACAVFQGALP